MTFNLALIYFEFFSMSCFECQMYLQYILNSFDEFNGYSMVSGQEMTQKCVYVYCLFILHLVDL